MSANFLHVSLPDSRQFARKKIQRQKRKRRQIIQISKQRNQQKRERLADRERKVRILMHALNGWNRLFVSD